MTHADRPSTTLAEDAAGQLRRRLGVTDAVVRALRRPPPPRW
ncbi:hypothetical protein [Nocardia amamiensis]|nr:hypothetical protein [Nocardia amamiensis]